jgi:tRNA A-37 threonylcarbamoyl transferase component Bud32
MQKKGVTHYELTEEGDIVSYHERHLAEFGLADVTDRVEFFQADATNLKPQFSGYDLILAANLIDRLYPIRKRFLTTIHERLTWAGFWSSPHPIRG